MDVGAGNPVSGDPQLGLGTYSLTNGLLLSFDLRINGRGNFFQYGGVHSNAIDELFPKASTFTWTQPGGTNYWYNVPGHYYLNERWHVHERLG